MEVRPQFVRYTYKKQFSFRSLLNIIEIIILYKQIRQYPRVDNLLLHIFVSEICMDMTSNQPWFS